MDVTGTKRKQPRYTRQPECVQQPSTRGTTVAIMKPDVCMCVWRAKVIVGERFRSEGGSLRGHWRSGSRSRSVMSGGGESRANDGLSRSSLRDKSLISGLVSSDCCWGLATHTNTHTSLRMLEWVILLSSVLLVLSGCLRYTVTWLYRSRNSCEVQFSRHNTYLLHIYICNLTELDWSLMI